MGYNGLFVIYFSSCNMIMQHNWRTNRSIKINLSGGQWPNHDLEKTQ